jgi:hypothetical protein
LYYLVFPKTIWGNHPDFGEWIALKDDENSYVTFDSVKSAQEYGDAAGRPYYVLELVG